MQSFRFLALLALLNSLAACNSGPPPTPVAAGPFSLPGERSSNAALATPPDEWTGPKQTAQAVTDRP
jgi:hypothetical protein